MRKVYTVPPAVKHLIESYAQMSLGSSSFACPYFINSKYGSRGLRALVGKGSPEEIKMELMIVAHRKGLDLNTLSSEQFRTLMQAEGIGIDCSGFVVHLLDAWLKFEHKGKLIDYLQFRDNGLAMWLRRKLRPVENIGANILTSELNCHKIDINQVRPGDLIRSKGLQKNSHHVLLVTSVHVEDGRVQELVYWQSARNYGNENGVRWGKIKIIDPEIELKDQQWDDQTHGRQWALEELLIDYPDNGLRRLNKVELGEYVAPEILS